MRAVGPWAGPNGRTRPRQSRRPILITRLDSGTGRVATDPLPEEAQAVVAAAGAVLVSDYGRGIAAHPRIRALLRAAADHVPVVWNPHPRGPVPIPGAAVVTPNRARALDLLSGRLDEGPDLWKLAKGWAVQSIAVTLGSEGALLCLRASGKRLRIPIPAAIRSPEGSDTCGAADSFSVAVATLVREGHGPEKAVRRAVIAAAEFVGSGAATAFSELGSAVIPGGYAAAGDSR
ncbi:PfkB family carbohydrate kinase [Nocardia asteroides]